MKLNRLKYLIRLSFWRICFHLFRNLWYQRQKKYQKAIHDLNWIIKNTYNGLFLNIAYQELGVNYAYLKEFEKAELHLLKALEYEPDGKNGFVCMWLGYVYLVMGDYAKSIYYFRQAHNLGSKGLDKLVVDREYVRGMICKTNDRLRSQFNDFLPGFDNDTED